MNNNTTTRNASGFTASVLTWCGIAALSSTSMSYAAPEHKTNNDSGVKVNAYIDANYGFNIQRKGDGGGPGSSDNPATNPQNNLRWNDVGHRQFDLGQARVGVSKAAAPVGFDVQVGFGTQISRLNGVGTGSPSVLGTVPASSNVYNYLRRATANLKHGSMTMALGRFDTEFGLEKIDSALNWNYSRSFIFSNQHPKFMNGALVGYEMGDLRFSFAVSNGVNRYYDNNHGMALMGKVDWESGTTSAGIHYIATPENNGNSKEWRHYVNLNAKHEYSKTLWVGAEGNFFKGMNVPASATINKNAITAGVALYGNVSLMADHWEALRAEWFSDREGVVGLNNGGTRYWTLTGTHRYNYSENLSFWGEVRWDNANSDRFLDNSNALTKNNMVTLLVAGTYAL